MKARTPRLGSMLLEEVSALQSLAVVQAAYSTRAVSAPSAAVTTIRQSDAGDLSSNSRSTARTNSRPGEASYVSQRDQFKLCLGGFQHGPLRH